MESKNTTDNLTETDVSQDDPDNCPICLEKIGTRGMVRTECGHTFCYKCFCCSLARSIACPLCRQDVLEVDSTLRSSLSWAPGRSSLGGQVGLQQRFADLPHVPAAHAPGGFLGVQLLPEQLAPANTPAPPSYAPPPPPLGQSRPEEVGNARLGVDRSAQQVAVQRLNALAASRQAVADRLRTDVRQLTAHRDTLQRSAGGGGRTGLNPPDDGTQDTGEIVYRGAQRMPSAEQSMAHNNHIVPGCRVLVHVTHARPCALVSIYKAVIITINRRTCKVRVDDDAFPPGARATFNASILHGQIVPDTPIMRESFAAFWRATDAHAWRRNQAQNVQLSNAVPAAYHLNDRASTLR